MIRRRATSQSGAPTGRLKQRPPVAPALTLREKLFWAAAILVVGGVLASLLWPVFSLLFASAALAYILSPQRAAAPAAEPTRAPAARSSCSDLARSPSPSPR